MYQWKKNIHEEEYKIVEKKVRLIYELFQLEVIISKNQKNKLKREEILVNFYLNQKIHRSNPDLSNTESKI